MRKGWFRKARIKWINKNVYSFEFSKSLMFGSDVFEQRYDNNGMLRYHYKEPNWYLDMCKEGGFTERLLFCSKLKDEKEFHLRITLKKNVKY